MRIKLHKWAMIAVTCLIILVSGCAWSIGGKGHEPAMQPTLGKELIDLKSARDQGAITESYRCSSYRLPIESVCEYEAYFEVVIIRC